MTIYVDEVFVLNWLMDALVLWLTARLIQRRVSLYRICGAALPGALYSVLIFCPGGVWLSHWAIKLICSLIMVWIAFGWVSWQAYGKAVIYLYLVSFALGGATLALMYWGGEWIIQTWSGIALMQVEFKLFWLLGALGLLLVCVRLLQKSILEKLEQRTQIVSVQANLRKKCVGLRLMVDSGNCLTDPLTGKPVAVVQTRYIRPLLTKEEYQVLEGLSTQYSDVTQMVLHLPTLTERVRLIPFQSVGYQGVLLGIRLDSLKIAAWGVETMDTVIALTTVPFASDGAYQGIIAPFYDV